MKKTLFAFMALATAFGATSCQSDEELPQAPQEPTNGAMVINAVTEGIGAGTRATMAYKYDVLWSQSDQIYVKNSTNNATFTLTEGAGTTEGTFREDGTPVDFSTEKEVEAFYPASLVQADGSLKWPDKQDKNTIVPMYSKQTLGGTGTENFSFASLGAMLQIVFNTEQENITLKSITLKDGTNPLSGAFTVNDDGKAAITATDKAGITLDLGTGKALGKGANFFHIAVPAGTYSNLSITFTATDNRTCAFTDGNVTLNHNTVGRLVLTGTKFTTSATTGKAYAKAPNCDVNWVQLWKDGPKFAEYNVGAAYNKAEDYGGYYAWGGYQDKVDDHKTVSSTLTGADDTATRLWGSEWRMPTQAQLEALLTECDVAWTSVNGVNGRKFTGKGDYKDNSVFLPAAGGCRWGNVYGQGDVGVYWSSTHDGRVAAYYLYFGSGFQYVYYDLPDLGYSVRAVLAE